MLSYFAICCDASINVINGKVERVGDPTELALLDINYSYGLNIKDYKRFF
ncbi:MAG: hypothetical protein L6U99_12065 [Clostridium sp.]|nr:MAG: hypothetical protein L6U99_12065 [Clostridium sp.]